MKHPIFYSFILLLVLTSCRGPRTVIGTQKANASLAVKNIMTAHRAAMPAFRTLASRVKVAYKDEKQSQSITVSLRMERDKKIWIKASILGITLAKGLITPENVSYYETLGNTYFNGNFALLSDWLGTDLDFDKTQAILLGQSIFPIEKSYVSSVLENKYRLQPKVQPRNFIHFVLLNPDNFKVNSGKVFQPAENRGFSVQYGPYQEVEGSFFPSEIGILAEEGTSKTTIDVTYRNIDLNVSVSFPFKIPEGYTPIELK